MSSAIPQWTTMLARRQHKAPLCGCLEHCRPLWNCGGAPRCREKCRSRTRPIIHNSGNVAHFYRLLRYRILDHACNPSAVGALAIVQGVINVIRDSTMDDNAREETAQSASVRLLRAFASVLPAASAPIYVSDLLGLAPSESVMMFLSRWEVILKRRSSSAQFIWLR